MDSNWDFVVHGGIDGYSRLITLLSSATNNQASECNNVQKQLIYHKEFCGMHIEMIVPF